MPERNQTNPSNQPSENNNTTAMRKEERAGTPAMNPRTRSSEAGHAGMSPFSFMRRFMDEMDRMFEDFGTGSTGTLLPRYGRSAGGNFATWAPRVDVFERDNKLIVRADLPGLRQEDVEVRIADDMLLISGERSHEHEHETGGVYQCERSYGRFDRRIALPDGITPESVNATFDNGVLEITMPMPSQKASGGRSVPIQTKGKGITH